MTGSGSLALLRQIVELLKRKPITTLLKGPKDKVSPEDSVLSGGPRRVRGRSVLTQHRALWPPLLTWTQRLGWPFSNGNSRAFCGKRGMGGVMEGGLLGSPSSPNLAASLTFTVTFSRGSGGTRGWQEPQPGTCQHSVASAGSEHGASSRQPRGGSSCSRTARQRLRCARGSAGRRRGYCVPHTCRPAPLPPRAGPCGSSHHSQRGRCSF